MANTIEKGTTLTIIDEGMHFFPLGATVTIEGDHDTNEAIFARGITKFGITATQLIRATDFVVEGGSERSNVTVGTKVRVTGGRMHIFDVGTEGIIERIDSDGDFYVKPTTEGVDFNQYLSRSDFEVIGQADGAQVPTKTKGDDTLTKTTETTYEVGQAVRITGASVARLESMLMGEEITTHSLPIGAVTEVLEVCNVDEYVRLSVEGLELTHNHTKEGPQWVKFEHVEAATDFWFPVSGSTEDEPVSPPIAEELERLTKETVQELRAGDKVIYVGDDKIEDDEDMTVGKEYEITEGFGEGSYLMATFMTGGYAGFTDNAGDACAITRGTASGFAKA